MENKVLAIISGNEITEKDLNNIIMRYPEDKRGFFTSDMGKKQLLEQMIQFELMNKLGSEMELDKTEEFKAQVKQAEKDLLTQATVNKVLSEVTVTEEEAKKYYDETQEMFRGKESVSAKHILVDNAELCSEIKAKIDNNELTFEEAANQYSSCPSKEQGGNLGEFGRGMMVPEFENAAFELEIGVVSEPVQTQFGYHLIKVESKNGADVMPFEAVKQEVLARLNQQAQENKFMSTIKELENKYEVKRF
jgi:peptidyl-prolyl cis-trans isomerase C